MKKHTKVYLDHFAYCTDDFIPCECCGSKAVDIHHLDCRGIGGSKDKDFIENLMAVCRGCHEKFGDKKQYIEYLKETHLKFMEKWERDATESIRIFLKK